MNSYEIKVEDCMIMYAIMWKFIIDNPMIVWQDTQKILLEESCLSMFNFGTKTCEEKK
jgi:peptide deformylase